MFGFRTKRAEVIDHWYALVPNFKASTKDFYEGVEKELKECQVPGLELFRVDFAEGSILSQKREYLRMTRERLVFDICAAPFGASYFFSCRFAEIPAPIKLWQLAVVILAGFLVVALVFHLMGLMLGAITLVAGILLLIYTLRNAVSMGLTNLDTTLIKSPVVGPIYENWFRKETYYRHDTRLMYCDTVNSVVKAQVEQATGSKGIKLIRYMENCPLLSELYKPKEMPLPKQP